MNEITTDTAVTETGVAETTVLTFNPETGEVTKTEEGIVTAEGEVAIEATIH